MYRSAPTVGHVVADATGRTLSTASDHLRNAEATLAAALVG